MKIKWNETITCAHTCIHKQNNKYMTGKKKLLCPFVCSQCAWREWRKKALQMRIYYFVRCDCMSVLNICALTSDLFMAQFRHGLASLFHTRSLNNIVKHWTAREEKLNWIPSIFTDIRARARDRHTHSVLKQKRKIFACKWYISSDEPWIRIGVCMWAHNFYSFSFSLSVCLSIEVFCSIL